MMRKQQGITFIGWLVLLVPLAILVYAGIRLAPIYMNYYRVSQALTQVAADTHGGPVNPQFVKTALEKRFDIESIEKPSVKDIELRREGDSWVAEVQYDETVPMMGNISLLIQFDKQVPLQ
ncbi:MAG TPA: DUF4845 domain-containing protein [Steroidobacteraceae bacterium]|nr:DUF4845 domain-containing protein [Steroidobacteraceae bacterium]